MKKRTRKHQGRKTLVTLSMLAAVNAPALALAQAITCPQNLMFGSIIPCSAAAGTATVDPDASSSSSPGCLNVGGAQLQGRCVVTGTFFPVQAMQISIAAAVETITNGTANMDVDDFIVQDASGNGAGPTITITAFLTSVNIGGTLNIDAGQAGGTYSGAVTVNVVYQ